MLSNNFKPPFPASMKMKILRRGPIFCYTLFNFTNEMIEGYGMGTAQLKERKCLFDVR